MGKDPRTSVLNSNCQAREVKNLFVVDGSCFTTSPEKNPTLTIMALAARTAHHMAAEVKKRNLSYLGMVSALSSSCYNRSHGARFSTGLAVLVCAGLCH